MTAQLKGQGQEFWAPHIEAMRQQGKQATVYAREHGLSVHSLGWLRRKLNPKAEAAPAVKPKFVQLKGNRLVIPS